MQPREHARALASALVSAGYPDHGRAVRMLSAPPARVEGAGGVTVLVRYALTEGPPGSWVADLLSADGSSRCIATEAGPTEQPSDGAGRLVSRSIRVDADIWEALGDAGDRQEIVRSLIERYLRERGRMPLLRT